MTSNFDSEAFRRFEHEGWNSLYAGYHSQWEHLTTQAIPSLLDATGVERGMSVLDVACGPGYVSAAASERGCKTQGVDLSENMIELSQQSHPELAFQVGDAESLPFENESFDAVLINFGVLHFPDAEKALAETFRVLRPDGRLGFTAWSGPQGSAIGIALDAIATEGSLEVDLPAGTPIFRFADHQECQTVLSVLGFGNIVCTNSMLTWTLSSPSALMSSFQQATARISGLLAAQDPTDLAAIEVAMTERCMPFVKGDRAELPMPATLAVATKD